MSIRGISVLPVEKRTSKIWRHLMLEKKTFQKKETTQSITFYEAEFDEESDFQKKTLIPPSCFSTVKMSWLLFFCNRAT